MHGAKQTLVICESCGKLHRWPAISSRAVAHCIRCEAVLGRGHRVGVETLLALTLAALFVFIAAQLTDVASIRLRGPAQVATFPMAVAATWREGERIVAVVSGLTAIVAPALFIVLRLYVLLPLAAGRVPPGFRACMRWLHYTSRWNMVEVLTVAAVVSIVRLADLAEAQPGPALYALGALALLLAAIESAGLKHLWRELP